MEISANKKPLETEDDFSEALCARIKAERKARSWSLEELAAASGVSRSMLSEIERGGANPTLAVMRKIANAYALSIGELLDEPVAQAKIEVISADDPAYLYKDDSKCRIRTLSPLHMEKNIEIYEVRLQPGAALYSAAHFKGAREFATVQQGTAEVTSGDECVTLKKGASAHYRADAPHAIKNAGRGECVVYLVVTYE